MNVTFIMVDVANNALTLRVAFIVVVIMDII